MKILKEIQYKHVYIYNGFIIKEDVTSTKITFIISEFLFYPCLNIFFITKNEKK